MLLRVYRICVCPLMAQEREVWPGSSSLHPSPPTRSTSWVFIPFSSHLLQKTLQGPVGPEGVDEKTVPRRPFMIGSAVHRHLPSRVPFSTPCQYLWSQSPDPAVTWVAAGPCSGCGSQHSGDGARSLPPALLGSMVSSTRTRRPGFWRQLSQRDHQTLPGMN